MVAPGPALRAVDGGDASENANGMPTLYGHFLRFDEWTHIKSYYEGDFLERMAPGCAKKTIRERGDKIRCLFQHGYDYVIGDKPLGPFDELKEDGEGVYYEVPLLDVSYNHDLVPGLETGLYGASFRMRVMREEWVEEPGKSDHNPNGLPERTIKEIVLFEGGPVTFPAYDNATAAVRSLTDHFLFEAMTRDPARTRELVAFAERCEQRTAARHTKTAADADLGSSEELRARTEAAHDALLSATESGDRTAIAEASEALADANQAERARHDAILDHARSTGASEEHNTTSTEETTAPPNDSAGTSHPADGRRDNKTPLRGVGTHRTPFGVLPDRGQPRIPALPRR